MTKRAIIAILFALPFTVAAQISEPGAESAYAGGRDGDQPDIPGTFVVELGINRGLDAPERFDLGFWGSRTVNIYYTYALRIAESKFSLVPGIGLSLERYKFRNYATLGFNDADGTVSLLLPSETAITGERKSQLITNYIDVPVELRFMTNPSDPNRSFKASIGGRIGYLYDAFTKMKYKVDGEPIKQYKDKQLFNLNRFRYGVSGRIGIGNFSVFGYYNLTPLFKEGEGPAEDGVINDFQTFTVGISLSAF